MDEILLSSVEVAKHLAVTENVLAIMRHRGEGPKYLKLSRRAIRYRMRDVDLWTRSRGVDTTDSLAMGS